MPEHPSQPLDDREAEPEAPCDPRALIESLELLEHRAAVCSVGMPSPVSQTSIRTSAPARRQPTSTRPFSVYLSALETRFCNRRRMRRRSVRIARVDGTKRNSSPLALAIGANSISSIRMRSATGTSATSGLGRAGVEPRNVEKGGENLLDRFERDVDVAGEVGPLGSSRAGQPLRRANWRRAAPR